MQMPEWIAAISALAGLGVLVAQIRHNSRVSAIETARKFIEETRDLWDLCKLAAGADPFDAASFENALGKFIAQLELNAAVISEISLPDRIHRMIERTIISFINEMMEASYDPYLEKLLANPAMCPCLKDFCVQRARLLGAPSRTLKAMRIQRS
jgi:hypothetical protein